ncbi:hypothetical protein ACFSTC_55550 [Nonomuraea ferruginea]
MGVYALVLPLDILLDTIPGDGLAVSVLMEAVTLVSTVWIAATAREMPKEDRLADLPPARQRAIRVAVAAVAVLPVIAQIHPEQAAHLTHTGWSMGCYDRPSFGDLKPEERDAAFLCLARSRDGGVPPIFPDSLSDQGVLSYARALCRAKDRDEQTAILTRAGSARPAWGADPWDLVYVCPEIIGATHPELLRSTAEKKAASDAYLAERNASCRDPWPRTKGVVQATATYFLFADGDAGYLVHDPGDPAAQRGGGAGDGQGLRRQRRHRGGPQRGAHRARRGRHRSVSHREGPPHRAAPADGRVGSGQRGADRQPQRLAHRAGDGRRRGGRGCPDAEPGDRGEGPLPAPRLRAGRRRG